MKVFLLLPRPRSCSADASLRLTAESLRSKPRSLKKTSGIVGLTIPFQFLNRVEESFVVLTANFSS